MTCRQARTDRAYAFGLILGGQTCWSHGLSMHLRQTLFPQREQWRTGLDSQAQYSVLVTMKAGDVCQQRMPSILGFHSQPGR